MEYGLTTTVRKRMKMENTLLQGKQEDYRFCWEINLTKIAGKNTLIIVHASSRYCIIYRNMKPSFWKNFSQEIDQAISNALQHEGFTEEEVQRYFTKSGETVLTKTHGRKVMGGVNHITTELPYYRCDDPDPGLLQTKITEALNEEMVSSALHPEYTCIIPRDFFKNEMKKMLRGEEMKLEFATVKGGGIIRKGVLEWH